MAISRKSRTTFLAESAVEIAMMSGIARPRACGQEMTRIVPVFSIALPACPSAIHTTSVLTPAAVAT